MLTQINKDEVKMESKDLPNLYISRETYNILIAFAQEAKGEISGFLEVEEVKTGFRLFNPLIFEQECTGSTTELDTTAVSAFFDRIVREGKDPTVFRCWWHSHADMNVFYSGEDVSTIKGLLQDWEDFAIGITVNRKGEIYTRLEFSSPFAICIENLPIFLQDEVSEEMLKFVKDEVFDKVKEKTYPSYTPHESNYGRSIHRSDLNLYQRRVYWDRDKRMFLPINPELHEWNSLFGEWVEKGKEYSKESVKETLERHREMRNNPGAEPQKSGKYDSASGKWRHATHGLPWSFEERKWKLPKGQHSMICGACNSPYQSLMFNETYQDWICKVCRKGLASFESSISSTPLLPNLGKEFSDISKGGRNDTNESVPN